MSIRHPTEVTLLRISVLALLVLVASACAGDEGAVGDSAGIEFAGDSADPETETLHFPPDRAAWESAPPVARAAHARALHRALESTEEPTEYWTAGGLSGRITILATRQTEETICRSFEDRIEHEAAVAEVRDVACRGEEWEMLGQSGSHRVLEPAFLETARVYVVKRGGSLADVAKRTGADVAALERLNPAYPDHLSAGTPVLLP